MKKRYWILILLIPLLFSITVIKTQAQDDDPPLDDEFIAALVLMSVNHNMMEGKDEIRDLTALKDFVDSYYDDRIASVQTSGSSDADQMVAWLQDQKLQQSALIRNKIDEEYEENWFNSAADLLHSLINPDEEDEDKTSEVRSVVSGKDDPPEDYFDTMNSLVMTDIEAQVNLLLDINTITVQPSLAPAISDSSSWNYDVPTITDSSSPITPTAIDDPAPTQGSTSEVDPGGVTQPIYKPLRFTNNGFDPVTVLVETYEPAAGYSPAKPTGSTVVFPESNSSAYMDLPLGTYTFCYYWPLEDDYNGDGYFDYHHRTTSSISLNNNSSDNPESAIAMTLSPDSVVSNPNGRCGEEIAEDNSNLTPEEAANQGTHNYLVTCSGMEWCEGESSIENLAITFSSGSVNILNTDEGDPQLFTRIGQNQYSWTNYYGDVFILTFTMEGLYYSANDDSGVFVFTRQ